MLPAAGEHERSAKGTRNVRRIACLPHRLSEDSVDFGEHGFSGLEDEPTARENNSVGVGLPHPPSHASF